MSGPSFGSPEGLVDDAAFTSDAAFEAYGAVLLLDARTLRIQNVAASSEAVLGVDAGTLIGQSLDAVVEPFALRELEDRLAVTGADLGWFRTNLISGDPAKLHGFYVTDDLIGLDVVPVTADMLSFGAEAIERVATWSERLLAIDDPVELLEVAASQVRTLTQYGGAWAVRTDEGYSVVVATDSPGVGDTVGQQVLATDVPPTQPHLHGRALPFFVADLDAPPVPLVAPPPVDATFEVSSLHRPYPAFLQRLHDIGVRATLSIPITVGGRLWGQLIAHNPEPRRIGPALQSELRLLGGAVSTHLAELLRLAEAREQLVHANRSAQILRAVAGSSDLFDGLVSDPDALLALCGTPSALVSIDGVNAVLGIDLDAVQREHILALAREELAGAQPVVAKASISVPIAGPSARWRPGGYLAVRLGEDARNLVVWLRPEREGTVRWVNHVEGDPTDAGMFPEMTARSERPVGTSERWSAAQIQAIGDFRVELASLTVDRYQQLAQRATALTRSNAEFNAFAHTAAHDLKQPIRGIRQYTEFFLEDTAHKLDDEERGQLETIQRLSTRMTGLIDDLMRYAELGDATWQPQRVDLQPAVDEAIELLPPDALQDASISVEQGMIEADPSALQQLLLNLIGNALKYRGEAPATIDIAMTTLSEAREAAPDVLSELPGDTPVLAVRDRGIGIPARYHSEVFGLFRQLDAGSEGSGAGLALCRRIAHRHGGEIWLTSTPGVGTTFFVSLGAR